MKIHKATVISIENEKVTIRLKLNVEGCEGCGLLDACNKNGEKVMTLQDKQAYRLTPGQTVTVGEYKQTPLWLYLVLAAMAGLLFLFPDRPETAAAIVVSAGFLYFYFRKYAGIKWEILPD